MTGPEGPEKGRLYLCPTPIGNLEDITLRTLRVLREVTLIAAEDTRQTLKLLNHYGIKTPLLSYHKYNQAARIPSLLEHLRQGDRVALVTDAGMPVIADPGWELVRAARAEGAEVIPLPGASAVTTALAASGLAGDRFVFEGFLPRRGRERQERLTTWTQETRPVVFYEAPHRLEATAQELATLMGEREVLVARELTKRHEQLWYGTVAELAAALARGEIPARGEFTLVLAGANVSAKTPSPISLQEALRKALRRGLSKKKAAAEVAAAFGCAKRLVYQEALEMAKEEMAKEEKE